MIVAKISTVPVWRSTGGHGGKPHTVPRKVTGCCDSAGAPSPQPRGTGIISAPVSRKLLRMAGTDGCHTLARGCTATWATSSRPSPSPPQPWDLWEMTVFITVSHQEFMSHLVKTHTRVSIQMTQAPDMATPYNGFYTRKIK